MKKLLIFGAGKIAESVSYYFNRDSEYTITAYVVDDAYATTDTYLGKPLYGISQVEEKFNTNDYFVFVAVGYQGINGLRAEKYEYFKNLGYRFASYQSPQVQGNYTVGENSIVMDGAIIQPCATIGNDVFVWGGAMIGHHTNLQDHCWITGGCSIGGIVELGEKTFVGLGAIISNEITIGKQCMIGANAFVGKDIEDKKVFIVSPTEPHRLNADQLIRLSVHFRI